VAYGLSVPDHRLVAAGDAGFLPQHEGLWARGKVHLPVWTTRKFSWRVIRAGRWRRLSRSNGGRRGRSTLFCSDIRLGEVEPAKLGNHCTNYGG